MKARKIKLESEVEQKEKRKVKLVEIDVNTEPEGFPDIFDEINANMIIPRFDYNLSSGLNNKRSEFDIKIVDDGIKRALHDEITAFERHIDEKNKKNNENYNHLIELIRRTIDEAIPNSRVDKLDDFFKKDYKLIIFFLWTQKKKCLKVDIYGSFETGLSLPWSDIDIVVTLPSMSMSYDPLTKIENALKVNIQKKSLIIITLYLFFLLFFKKKFLFNLRKNQ